MQFYNKLLKLWKKNMKSRQNTVLRARGKVLDSEDGLNFQVSVDKIRPKVCVNPIKTAVNRVTLEANNLPRVKIKINHNFLSRFLKPQII